MSSSTSSTSAKSGECVVCGKECWTRCPDCAAKGTGWMFFCSRDHQKLIWPVHRRFCGRPVRPFPWPLFTESEARTLLSRHRQWLSAGGTTQMLWTESTTAITRHLNMPFEKVVDLITAGSLREGNVISHYCAGRTRSSSMALKTLVEAENDNATIPGITNLIAKDPIGAVVQFQGILMNDAMETEWGSQLRHRLIILFTLLSTYWNDTSQLPTFRPYLTHAVRALKDCGDNISPQDPLGRLKRSNHNAIYSTLDDFLDPTNFRLTTEIWLRVIHGLNERGELN